MSTSLFVAATGMTAQQRNVDVISNNLANVNTTAFKRGRAEFQDLFYQTVRAPGSQSAAGIIVPSGLQFGVGVGLVGIANFFGQGPLSQTGNPLDMAIEGSGFFQLLNANGDIVYTRDGSFQLNQDGQFVTTDGFALEPAITVPDDSVSITVGIDGIVTTTLADLSTTEVGQLELARFINPAGLFALGRNSFSETEASGPALLGNPTADGAGNIRQGFIESSNVEVVQEIVNLIIAQRAFEVNANVLRSSDEMMQTTGQLLQ